jgi:hypothetical protein
MVVLGGASNYQQDLANPVSLDEIGNFFSGFAAEAPLMMGDDLKIRP